MDIPLRILRMVVKARRIIRPINLLSFFIKIKTYFSNFWLKLNFAQRCYFIGTSSAFLLLLSLENESSANFLFFISLFFAVIALLVEFWPKFVAIWHHLLGKTFIVIFYGIMANFALASAGGMVNDVAGVSSSVLPYSHNMALILNIPTWFLLTTLLVLVIIQLSVPFYLVLLLLLKPFGLHGFWHKQDYKFVFTTAVIRYMWCTVLLCATVIFSVNNGLINHTTPILGNGVEGFISDRKLEEQQADENEVVDPSNKSISLFTFNSDNDDELPQRIYNKSMIVELMIKKLLAEFIYNYEADNYSRCFHPVNTKVVELNDYQLLLIKIDKSQPVGFSYNVIACQSPGID
jgi:hypothetical protein